VYYNCGAAVADDNWARVISLSDDEPRISYPIAHWRIRLSLAFEILAYKTEKLVRCPTWLEMKFVAFQRGCILGSYIDLANQVYFGHFRNVNVTPFSGLIKMAEVSIFTKLNHFYIDNDSCSYLDIIYPSWVDDVPVANVYTNVMIRGEAINYPPADVVMSVNAEDQALDLVDNDVPVWHIMNRANFLAAFADSLGMLYLTNAGTVTKNMLKFKNQNTVCCDSNAEKIVTLARANGVFGDGGLWIHVVDFTGGVDVRAMVCFDNDYGTTSYTYFCDEFAAEFITGLEFDIVRLLNADLRYSVNSKDEVLNNVMFDFSAFFNRA
jgi:hypothetical protein